MYIVWISQTVLMKTVILVGTETGNSLHYATRLCEDFERLRLENELFLIHEVPLEEFLEDSLETVIFVCSTTGDGEESGHMRSFMKFCLEPIFQLIFLQESNRYTLLPTKMNFS